MAKKTKKLHPGGFAQNDFMAGVRRQQRGQKNRGKVDSQQQRTPNQLTRQQHRAIKNAQKFLKQNPMMPTAGMSQGRPATGRTPMPGPAPDPERMKRFEKLMREQRERLNKLQKARMARRPAPPLKTRPNVLSLKDFYMDKKTGQYYYLPNRRK